jgi:hypothetical protein
VYQRRCCLSKLFYIPTPRADPGKGDDTKVTGFAKR